jgi:lysophospholipase L1-like esterase
MLLVSPPPFGKFSPFMELSFRGGEATGRGLAAAYATVAKRPARVSWTQRLFAPPGPVDGVHPDANGQRQLGEAIAKLIAA